MRAVDVLFYALSLAAVAGSLAATVQASLQRAAAAALAAAFALAGLWTLDGAGGIAALQAALATTAAVALLLDPAWMRGDDGDRWKSLRRAAMPALAWLVLAARVVLVTRWPVDASSSPPWPSPGLLHHLVLALVLLAIAFASAASRRSVRGAALALPLAGGATATMFVALSRFTAGGAAAGGLVAGELAAAAVASSWILAGAAVAMAGRDDEPAVLPSSFATGVSLASCGVALALLAGAWGTR